MPDSVEPQQIPGVLGKGGRYLTLAVWVCFSLLAACTPLTPAPSEPFAVVVPEGWSGAAAPPGAATPLASWWQRFSDTTLDALIRDALFANTSVTTAQAALRQARALRDVAAAALWPTLNGNGSAQRSKNGTADPGNRFAASLDANWELDIFGVNRNALGATDGTARASAANLGDVQVSIAAEVGLTYITLRLAQSRLAIATANLATADETLQITQWRLQAGLVTSLEVEQASAAAAQLRAQRPTLQTSINQSAHALAVLTGRPPAVLLTALSPLADVPQAANDLAIGIPAETLNQRADVRAAAFKVAAETSRLAQANAALLPKVSVGGSLGLASAFLDTLTNAASVLRSVFASVAAPLFDAGALRARVRAQQAVLDQAAIAHQLAKLTALKEVEDALIALRGDVLRLANLRNAADAAANASLLARQRFGSGLIDYQVVLETQRTQLGTQDSVANAFADVSADQVRLYKALGGGWVADPALSNSTARIGTP